MKPDPAEIGVGATEDLNLRVSVATLVRVLFENPSDGDLMLALERKATLREAEKELALSGPRKKVVIPSLHSGQALSSLSRGKAKDLDSSVAPLPQNDILNKERLVEVNSQPFGGAIRILDLSALRERIGDFRFDSERSRSEQDFRIFIRPSAWEAVREFCREHIRRVDDPVLETDPGRELAEEFADAIKISLRRDQYVHKPAATVVEDDPAPTGNIHARGYLTARIYRIFEAYISDSSLAYAMITNSESFSDQDLGELALEDARKGGKGRANAVLALPMKLISSVYSAMSPEERNAPVLFEKYRLDGTVAAVLEGISVPKYQRL